MKVRELRKPLVRGHVWRIQYQPWNDPHTTITKFALILQEGRYFQNYESVCVVLLTTVAPRRQYRTDVAIPRQDHGQSKDVWAICGQVHTLPVDTLLDYAYQLSEQTMERIDEALMYGLGLV